jgi:LPS O-antigen subunit length determinant protein (WzzB/FepE family)
MTKKHLIKYNDEINLVELFKVIWSGKITIALITLIFFVIISVNDKYKPKQPNLFESSLLIKPAKEEQFLSFLSLDYFNYKRSYDEEKVFNYNKENYLSEITYLKVLDKFVEEFLDYEELIKVLRENEQIKKSISQLSLDDQKKKLYEYAKLFSLKKIGENSSYYALEVTWPNNDGEIEDILDQTIKLVEESLARSIFLKLESHYRNKKNLAINRDLASLEFLSEQSSIAKRLNLFEAKERKDIILLDSSNKNRMNEFNYSNTYYLRGYKVIDMEIDLIKNRKYSQFDNIEKKIASLKEEDIKWVNYNLLLLDTKLQSKHNPLPSALIIIFGLLIGTLYVLISNVLKSYTVTRKK